MVLNIVTACLVCLMNFGLGSAVETTQQVACLAREDCSKQSQALSIIGVSNFFDGNYAVSGCYYKDNTAYFGTGGSIESMSETSLPGGNRRIWCESNLRTITAPTFTVRPPLQYCIRFILKLSSAFSSASILFFPATAFSGTISGKVCCYSTSIKTLPTVDWEVLELN